MKLGGSGTFKEGGSCLCSEKRLAELPLTLGPSTEGKIVPGCMFEAWDGALINRGKEGGFELVKEQG